MKYKYNVVRSPRFNRDLKKAAKLGLNTDEAEAVIRLLPARLSDSSAQATSPAELQKSSRTDSA